MYSDREYERMRLRALEEMREAHRRSALPEPMPAQPLPQSPQRQESNRRPQPQPPPPIYEELPPPEPPRQRRRKQTPPIHHNTPPGVLRESAGYGNNSRSDSYSYRQPPYDKYSYAPVYEPQPVYGSSTATQGRGVNPYAQAEQWQYCPQRAPAPTGHYAPTGRMRQFRNMNPLFGPPQRPQVPPIPVQNYAHTPQSRPQQNRPCAPIPEPTPCPPPQPKPKPKPKPKPPPKKPPLPGMDLGSLLGRFFPKDECEEDEEDAGKGNDSILLMMIMMLLSKEGSDQGLMMALMYIMM
jgi:hypothetical protein